MGRLAPVSWEELVRRLRRLGFEGPYWDNSHPFIVKGGLVLVIPNPHRGHVSVELLRRILHRAEGISSVVAEIATRIRGHVLILLVSRCA